MGKVIKFEKPESKLTPEETQACEIAKNLRDLFTEDEVEELKRELEDED